MSTLSAAVIAHVCHEANRALQKEQNDPTIPVSVKWSKLDEETRQSAIQGVENILSGKVTTPEQSHIEWCNFKTEHGWKLGPVKDEAKKEHPLLVPYAELPEAQRIKDELFFSIVRALSGNVLSVTGSTALLSNAVNEPFREGFGEGR